MSQSSSHNTSYPSRVQKILRRLQQGYGNGASSLALQALDVFAKTVLENVASPQPSVLSEAVPSLLRNAYTQCCLQTGTKWVHHALLYSAVRTIEPAFVYKPEYKTWPAFLLAQSKVFECQIMREQLHVRLIRSHSQP